MNRATLLQTGIRRGFQMVEFLSPKLAGRLVARAFFRPPKFERPAREVAWLTTASVTQVPFTGHYRHSSQESYYVVYQWGSGPTVLLLHGWAGRGSQLGAFVQPLVDAGYRVVTFDGPAHADSPGKQTNLLEFAQIIVDLSGRFRTRDELGLQN
ncbi:alpha/beta hydrolase [Chloroflexi bacterium TSY]|nr:alpha/beta hydrolase [Chloroflexi bacterium TSY]